MSTAGIGIKRHSPIRRHVPTMPARRVHAYDEATAGHKGPGLRLVDRLTHRWTVDLFDMDLQLESGDLTDDLDYGRS